MISDDRWVRSTRQVGGAPIARDEYAQSLRDWMDADRGERVPLIDHGEAHVIAALLDELAAIYDREPLGELARELAVRLNNRRGI